MVIALAGCYENSDRPKGIEGGIREVVIDSEVALRREQAKHNMLGEKVAEMATKNALRKLRAIKEYRASTERDSVTAHELVEAVERGAYSELFEKAFDGPPSFTRWNELQAAFADVEPRPQRLEFVPLDPVDYEELKEILQRATGDDDEIDPTETGNLDDSRPLEWHRFDRMYLGVFENNVDLVRMYLTKRSGTPASKEPNQTDSQDQHTQDDATGESDTASNDQPIEAQKPVLKSDA
jgi:hypothetical protein